MGVRDQKGCHMQSKSIYSLSAIFLFLICLKKVEFALLNTYYICFTTTFLFQELFPPLWHSKYCRIYFQVFEVSGLFFSSKRLWTSPRTALCHRMALTCDVFNTYGRIATTLTGIQRLSSSGKLLTKNCDKNSFSE